MSIVKCDAVTCAHNSDCVCGIRNIRVRCASGDCPYVYCGNYAPGLKARQSLLMQEISAINIKPGDDTHISCSAAGCVHNKNGACKADNIKITAPRYHDKACLCVSYKD